MSSTADHTWTEEHPEGEETFVVKGHHGATDKQYILIALILMVITGFEITISYVHVGWVFLPALLIMMTAKFIIVVSFFMHLKFDHKLFSFLFYTG
jgi:cytochrome c oxidase subunit 4